MIQLPDESANVLPIPDKSSTQPPSVTSPSLSREVTIGPGDVIIGSTVSQRIPVSTPHAQPPNQAANQAVRSLSQIAPPGAAMVEKVKQAVLPTRDPQLQRTIDTAKSDLTARAESVSCSEMLQRLINFNAILGRAGCWSRDTQPAGSLFRDISCPPSTQIAKVHANWLDDDKTMAGVMYPSLETRASVLEALMS